ncbi:hypothetical protein JXB27_04645 [Candidatus Woesearchaeota archaeon]|nr:hypothetical protein [Candidatus Woesearchaeota archaeon]
MNKFHIVSKLIYLVILLFLFPSVYAAYVDYDDDWEYNEGTNNDAVIWGGYYLDVGLNDLTSNADIECWDWDDNGEYGACFFENGVSMYECDDDYEILGDDGQYHAPSELYDGHCTLGDGGCDHVIPSGSSGDQWGLFIDAIYFEDCDGSASYTDTIDAEKYWVVYGHQYDCDNDPGPSTNPDYEGNFGSWLNIYSNTGMCSGSEECDENHDEVVSYGSTSTPSDPCRTKNWQSCSDEDDCISDKCEQDECSTCSDNQCTSAYWNSCTSNGGLCCSGDAVFGQYYCENYETWTDCTGASHTGCQHKGDYYCTLDSGDWRWRTCEYGCSGNSCTGLTEPDIDVTPNPLVFNIGQ